MKLYCFAHWRYNMKKCIPFLAFWLIIVLLCSAISFGVVKTDSVNRLKFHEFYSADDYSVIAIGSSSAQNGFLPEKADELLGTKTFNLGTSSQQMEGTYYMTLEALKRQKVDTVILDISYPILSREPGNIIATQIITDYMRGFNKVRFITDVMPVSQWPMMFSRLYREHDASFAQIRENLKAKLAPEYRSYASDSPVYTNYRSYMGRGYTLHESDNQGYEFFMVPEDSGSFDPVDKPIVPEQIEYLKKAIAACQQQGVNVLLVSFPKTELYLQQSGDYDAMHNYIQSIADACGVEFCDLNMVADVFWNDGDMANLDHCTPRSAALATEIICNYLKGDKPDFVSGIREKYVRDVAGVLYRQEGKEISWQVLSDTNRQFAYRLTGKDYDSGMIQENTVRMKKIPADLELTVYDAITGENLGHARKK